MKVRNFSKEETDILLDANRNGSSWLAENENGNWFSWKTKDKKLTADYGISRILNIQISDFWKNIELFKVIIEKIMRQRI